MLTEPWQVNTVYLVILFILHRMVTSFLSMYNRDVKKAKDTDSETKMILLKCSLIARITLVTAIFAAAGFVVFK